MTILTSDTTCPATSSASNNNLPCSFQVVGVAIGDTALVGKLLLLALGIEPGTKKRLAFRIKTMSRNKKEHDK